MALSKSIRAVVQGNPASPTHRVSNAEMNTLLSEMYADAALATDLVAVESRTTALETLGITGAIPKTSVAVATTGNVTLSGEQTLDDFLTSADRVLVWKQSAGSTYTDPDTGATNSPANGLYVTAAGAWARADDMNAAAEVAKAAVYVTGGTINAGKTCYTGSVVATLGTDPIFFVVAANETALTARVAAVEPAADLLPLFSVYTSKNLYTPDTGAALPVGAKAPANYNNGGTWGTALSYFGTTGIIAGLTIGEIYTVNIAGAPSSVTLSRAQGGFFWDGSNAFSSQVAHGTDMLFAADNRSVTFEAVTERVSFNLVRAPTSDAMAPIFTSVLAALMVNEGSVALPYEPVIPERPYVPNPLYFTASPDISAADVVVESDGAGYFYARTSWDATYDKVTRFRFGVAPTTAANNLWDILGERLISAAAPLDATLTAYNASALIIRGAVDEGPPLRLNSMWLGGGHGPVCRELTITGHGFVQADIGQIRSDGVRNRVLAQIIDANTVRFIAQNTGTGTSWAINTDPVNGSTLTHVSGGVDTSSKTVAADVAAQAYPFIRDRAGTVTLDGKDISAAGVYGGSVLRFSEQYDLPNLADALAYIVANDGAGDNSLIHEDVDIQIKFAMSHTLDFTGIVRTLWTAIDLEAYTPGQYGGAQTLRPETPAGGSLYAYVPRAATFSGFNFAAGQDITSWGVSEFFTDSRWTDPADPPTVIVFIARDSGAVPQWGHFYAIDDTVGQGKPTYRDDLGAALLLSSVKKAYLIAGYTESTAGAGQVHETVNYVGSFPPARDPALTWAVVHPKGTGHALSVRAPGALVAQWVSVDPKLIGRPVTLYRSGGVATLLVDAVQDKGVLMTFSGAGDAEVTIG